MRIEAIVLRGMLNAALRGAKPRGAEEWAKRTLSSGFLAPPAQEGSQEEAAAPDPPDPVGPLLAPNSPTKAPLCLEGLLVCLDGLRCPSTPHQLSEYR